MKISFSYKHIHPDESLESETSRSIAKMERLLKSYEPDLIQVHGLFSKNLHNEEHSVSLNLSLPTGVLHATGAGKNARAACKSAFTELEAQLKKHQSRLRRDYQWKRKRPLRRLAESV